MNKSYWFAKIPKYICLLFVGLTVQSCSTAGAAEALKVPDKETLFQRVLVKPGATLYAKPNTNAQVRRDQVSTFTVFYVYSRNQGWVEVGTGFRGEPLGWIHAGHLLDWETPIVVSFNNPANRERTLIFRDLTALNQAIETENVATNAASLRRQAVAGTDTGPVIALEPEVHVDIEQKFYILPVLEHKQMRLPGRQRGKALRITTISTAEDNGKDKSDTARKEALENYNIGIVFVIDTTRSMKPYIEATRQAMQRLAEKISRSEIGERVRFGLIGFRDHVGQLAGVEYVTENFLPLSLEASVQRFIAAISEVHEATGSTAGFNEDSLAGVHKALTQSNWEPFGARFIFLITDAGPREDELRAVPDLDVVELQRLGEENDVSVFSIHLKTPEGVFDHEAASTAYQTLSVFNKQQSYYSVEGGSPQALQKVIQSLTEDFSQQIEAAMEGLTVEESAAADDDPVARIGYAMQMAYLGRTLGTRAPEVFEGWLLDKDIPNFNRESLDVRIMLTKNQLSTLSQVVRKIVELGRENQAKMNQAGFFDKIRTAVAYLGRDPDRVVQTEIQTLGDAVGDYLVGLPYTSQVMDLDERKWSNMRGGAVTEFLRELKSKLAAYNEIDADANRWVSLYPGTPDGEKVAVIPLSLMP